MYFKAIKRGGGAVEIWTEEDARKEIIDTLQCDMGLVIGDGATDEEIENEVTNGDIQDFLDSGSFEGVDYILTGYDGLPPIDTLMLSKIEAVLDMAGRYVDSQTNELGDPRYQHVYNVRQWLEPYKADIKQELEKLGNAMEGQPVE